jgi:hypothetical protein
LTKATKAKPRAKKIAANTKYLARPGSGLSNTAARILGAELDAMEAARIQVTAKNLLKRIERGGASHPLYNLFEWDDAVAAMRWRLEQARGYIASVEIVVRESTGEQGRARLSVVVVENEKSLRSYQTREVVVDDGDLLAQVSVDLYARVRSAVREAHSLNLTKQRAWAAIYAAVSQNEPQAVMQRGGIEA